MAVRVLFWDFGMMTMLDLLAQPHSSIPWLYIRFITPLYMSNLFSMDSWDFFLSTT
jgi:hypothetical protein